MTKRAVLFVLITLLSLSSLAATAGARDENAPDGAPTLATASGLGAISAGGAVQFLYQWRQDDAGTRKIERFLTRRVQLSLYGQPADNTRYGIVLDAADGDLVDPAANGFELELREAWVGFDFAPWLAVDLGSFRPPWTLTLDDQVGDELFVRYPLLLTAGQFTPWRQTGGMVTGHGGDLFSLSVGLWNGLEQPDNLSDTNDHKDLMVAVKVALSPGVRMYVGDWRGKTDVVSGSTETEADYNNIWLGLELEQSGLNLGAEALWNRYNPESGSDVRSFGYQLSAAYDWHGIQPALRYELFDPDNATGADEREWTTLGINFMLNPSTRLMANYIFKSERLDNQQANDEFLVQLSAWF